MDSLGGLRDAEAATVDLSVVIPCRDVADVLPRQLEALAAQRWYDGGDATEVRNGLGSWEVIVADNGSIDGTAAVAAAFAERLPSLRVVDASTRPGRHHACNVGAAAARGAAVVFVDADDEVGVGYLLAMAEALHAHAFVAARLDHATLDPNWMHGVGSGVQTSGLQDTFGFLPHAAGASLGFQKAAFDAVGGFREHATYCEDVDISWRAQLAGYRMELVPGAVVQYRSRASTREMFEQHRKYGAAQALLFHDYRSSGMNRRPLKRVLDDWSAIARGALRHRTPEEHARWSRRAGRNLGRLEGSLRYRVWYP